jgi:hypothetical protein
LIPARQKPNTEENLKDDDQKLERWRGESPRAGDGFNAHAIGL